MTNFCICISVPSILDYYNQSQQYGALLTTDHELNALENQSEGIWIILNHSYLVYL